MTPPLFLDAPHIGPQMHIVTPFSMGKPLLFRPGASLLTAETKFIPVSFAAYGTGDHE
jgi:hypothetical protein